MDQSEHKRLAHFEEWYWWHRARHMIVRRILARFAPANTRILDVGCGTGATNELPDPRELLHFELEEIPI